MEEQSYNVAAHKIGEHLVAMSLDEYMQWRRHAERSEEAAQTPAVAIPRDRIHEALAQCIKDPRWATYIAQSHNMAHHLEALGKNPSAEKLPAFRSQLDNHWVDVTALTSGNRPLPQTVYTHFTLLLHRYIDFLEAHTYDAPFLFHAKKLRSFAKILYTGRFALLFKAMNLEFQPNMKRKSDEDYLRALDELCSSETAPAKSVHPTILGTEMPCENA